MKRAIKLAGIGIGVTGLLAGLILAFKKRKH